MPTPDICHTCDCEGDECYWTLTGCDSPCHANPNWAAYPAAQVTFDGPEGSGISITKPLSDLLCSSGGASIIGSVLGLWTVSITGGGYSSESATVLIDECLAYPLNQFTVTLTRYPLDVQLEIECAACKIGTHIDPCVYELTVNGVTVDSGLTEMCEVAGGNLAYSALVPIPDGLVMPAYWQLRVDPPYGYSCWGQARYTDWIGCDTSGVGTPPEDGTYWATHEWKFRGLTPGEITNEDCVDLCEACPYGYPVTLDYSDSAGFGSADFSLINIIPGYGDAGQGWLWGYTFSCDKLWAACPYGGYQFVTGDITVYAFLGSADLGAYTGKIKYWISHRLERKFSDGACGNGLDYLCGWSNAGLAEGDLVLLLEADFTTPCDTNGSFFATGPIEWLYAQDPGCGSALCGFPGGATVSGTV